MAVKFGTIDNALWRHPRFRGLSDDAKLMFVYLKTCPHQNILGCYYLPKMYIMSDLHWTEKRVNETLSELFEKPFARYCEATETMLLPKHLDMHPIQNLNQAKGAASKYAEINNNFIYINELAQSLLKSKFMSETVMEGFRKGLERVADHVTVSVTVSEPVTKKEKINKKKFNFKAELIDLGVSDQVASDWLKVRAKKKATNSETAFKAIVKEIELSKLDASQAITRAVENSWSGFKAAWVANLVEDNNAPTSPAHREFE